MPSMPGSKSAVLKVSGKIINPENPHYVKMYSEVLEQLHGEGMKIVVVVGGGPIARRYIECLRGFRTTQAQLDIIAVSYTHLPSPRDLSTSRMPSSA